MRCMRGREVQQGWAADLATVAGTRNRFTVISTFSVVNTKVQPFTIPSDMIQGWILNKTIKTIAQKIKEKTVNHGDQVRRADDPLLQQAG